MYEKGRATVHTDAYGSRKLLKKFDLCNLKKMPDDSGIFFWHIIGLFFRDVFFLKMQAFLRVPWVADPTVFFRDVEAPSPTVVFISGRRGAVPYDCKTTCRNSHRSCLPLWGRGTACGGRGLTFSRFFNISVFTFDLFRQLR